MKIYTSYISEINASNFCVIHVIMLPAIRKLRTIFRFGPKEMYCLIKVVTVTKHGNPGGGCSLLVQTHSFSEKIGCRIRIITFCGHYFQRCKSFQVSRINHILELACSGKFAVVLILWGCTFSFHF